jgi:hypothetical protein
MKKKPALKKKIHHRAYPPTKKVSKKEDQYIILVRSWVFLVLFALMLGIGAIVGGYINAQLNGSPTVAGVSTSR